MRRRGVVSRPAMSNTYVCTAAATATVVQPSLPSASARSGQDPLRTAGALASIRRDARRTRRRSPRRPMVTRGKRKLGYPTTTRQAIAFASHCSRAILAPKGDPGRSGVGHDRPQSRGSPSGAASRGVPARRRSMAHSAAITTGRAGSPFSLHSGRCGLPCRWWPLRCPRRIGNPAHKVRCCSVFPASRKRAGDRA